MDFGEEVVICRLCLKKLTKNCEPLEEIVQYTLNYLTLFLNLSISDDPMMCETCAMSLKKCFDFKTRCLSTEDCIASFVDGNDKKVDLRDVYLMVKQDRNMDIVPDDHSVCRFCLELVKHRASMSVQGDIDLIEILQKYFLEMDLRITDDVRACTACYDSLRFHVTFVNHHLSMEAKINEYCKVEGVNCKGQVDLRDVSTFISKNMLNIENISSVAIKEDKHESLVNTSVDIKVKFEDPMDEEEEKEKLVDDEIQDNNSFQHHPSSSQMDASRIELYKFEICPFETTRKITVQKGLVNNRPPPDVAVQGAMYKCDMCGYETKWRTTLKRHMQTHKTPSEITTYKCEKCTYETRYRYYLHQHMLIHMDKSKIEMHKCETCSFETKWKGTLRKHRLIHRDVGEAVVQQTIYKCEGCDYKTKWRMTLKRHMLTHKTSSDIGMYKCETCTYEAKDKYSLQQHMRIHMDVAKIELHKCEACPYKSKWKYALRRHLLTHKDTPDVVTRVMNKCNLCNYETNRMFNLKKHIRTHKTRSEATINKCDLQDKVEAHHEDTHTNS